MLTGKEIAARVKAGLITIEPFNEANLSPNSYDLTLASKLLVYTDPVLDPKRNNASTEITIPDEGFLLRPGELYIGSVNELTEAKDLVGVLHGKSSLGRLGLMVHITAGFIDNGYRGKITLELAAIKPIRVYANMKIAQLAYSEVTGEVTQYKGKYQGDERAEASKSFKDFK